MTIYVSDKDAFKDMTLEVSVELLDYYTSGLGAQVQLASDILENLCNGYFEYQTNIDGYG